MNMINTTTNGDLPQSSQTRIEIYPDGSTIGNPGPGGFGVIILRRNAAGEILKQMERTGRDLDTTNIRMEMTADRRNLGAALSRDRRCARGESAS